ncbi:MAG TPA: hypothetical protein PLD60_08600, partial [Leptospiraceae bacterium]|nr:hypothetical protein [Leptospiraceae bacterium]
LPKYLSENDATFGQSDEQLRSMFVSGLKRMYPDLTEDEILAFRISRVRRVVALSTLDYSRDLPGLDTTLPGTHIASSFQIVNGTLCFCRNSSVRFRPRWQWIALRLPGS